MYHFAIYNLHNSARHYDGSYIILCVADFILGRIAVY